MRKRYSFVLRKRYSALKKRSAFANEGRIPGRKGCSLRERCFAVANEGGIKQNGYAAPYCRKQNHALRARTATDNGNLIC